MNQSTFNKLSTVGLTEASARPEIGKEDSAALVRHIGSSTRAIREVGNGTQLIRELGSLQPR